MSPAELLHRWLRRQLAGDAAQWLDKTVAQLAGSSKDRDLYLAFSQVPRRLGKADLQLDAQDLRDADRARGRWNPTSWSVDQAGRILLLLSAAGTPADFLRRLDQLCVTADVGELVALYRGLPLYPDQPQYVSRAAEGVRSNMRAVLEGLAHRNPYPCEQMPEAAWNQMVLKLLFVGSTLAPVIGLDERANPALARMLCDYAHERWSAGRPVSPELWRCVGPFADDKVLADLERVLSKGTPMERGAAALALKSSRNPRAAQLLNSVPELAAGTERGDINWHSVALPS